MKHYYNIPELQLVDHAGREYKRLDIGREYIEVQDVASGAMIKVARGMFDQCGFKYQWREEN